MMQRLLLVADIASLRPPRRLVVDVRLPRRHTREEQLLDILERLTARLGEAEEDVDRHGRAEDTEDDVHLPLDVDERGRNKVTQSEVEDPVGRGGDSDSLSADAKREELGRVDPRDRTPGGRV